MTSRCPFLTLESDRLRKALVGRPQYTPDEHRRVFRACHRVLDELLGQGYPLLFDATNLTERNRRPVYAITRKRGAPLAIAVVTAPPEHHWYRCGGNACATARRDWTRKLGPTQGGTYIPAWPRLGSR